MKKDKVYTITTGERKFRVSSENIESALIFAAEYFYKNFDRMELFPKRSKFSKTEECIAILPNKLPIKATRLL